jgi:hypothetical protein
MGPAGGSPGEGGAPPASLLGQTEVLRRTDVNYCTTVIWPLMTAAPWMVQK